MQNGLKALVPDLLNLREPHGSYNPVFALEKCSLGLKNDHYWLISS